MSDSAPGSSTILLACGDQITQKSLQPMLEGAGYQVTLVAESRAAFQAVVATRPDLAILDAVATPTDALDTCRRLRADERFAYLPIITLTGPGARRLRLLALESGADEALALPLDREELLLRVHNLLLQDSRRASAVQHQRRLNMLMTLAAQLHVHLELSHIVATLYRALQEQMGFRKVVAPPPRPQRADAAPGGDGRRRAARQRHALRLARLSAPARPPLSGQPVLLCQPGDQRRRSPAARPLAARRDAAGAAAPAGGAHPRPHFA